MKRARFSLVALAAALAVFSTALAAGPRVLIISIDGCRPDALQVANTPNLDGLIATGAVSYTSESSHTATHSGPNYSSMLTGVDVPKHGVTGNDFSGSRFDLWPSLFHRLESVNPALYTASIVQWGPINTGIHINDVANLAVSDSDAGVTTRATNLLATGNPDVLFVELEDVDSAGHGSGFSPTNPLYIQAIEKSDQRVGTVLGALYARPGYISGAEDWQIITTTDHGGSGKAHEPSGGAATWTTFTILDSSSTPAGSGLGSPHIYDVAVTALEHTGYSTAGLGLDGQVLSGAGPLVYTWTNVAANGSWLDARNWSPRYIPGAARNIVVNSGSPSTTADIAVGPGGSITVSGAGTSAAFGGLTVAEGGALKLLGGGTVNVAGDLQMLDGSEYVSDLTAAGTGRITVALNASLGGAAKLTLRFGGSSMFKAGTYTLLSSGQTLSGSFPSVTNLGKYVSGNGLDYSGQQVRLAILKDLNPGDANLDTKTDVSDLNLWNQNKFRSGTDWTTGDFDGSGGTDVSDLNIWMAHRFTVAPGGAAALHAAPGGKAPRLVYNQATGTLTVDTHGSGVLSLIVPGPKALKIDDWQDGHFQHGATWAQDYFDAKEQWAATNLKQAAEGLYEIATYSPGLSAKDFGRVEYGRLSGGVLYAEVQIVVPEPATLVLLAMVAACYAAYVCGACYAPYVIARRRRGSSRSLLRSAGTDCRSPAT